MKIRTYAVALTAFLAVETSAHAADHQMRMSEVLLSNNGSTTSQYVELQDPAGESFPGGPYSLELYDDAGAPVSSQTITVPSGTTRLLVATAQAATDFSVTAQATLTLTLPTNGQLCFKGTSSGLIHCLAWGTISSSVIGALAGNGAGASPPDGMSLQRIGTTTTYLVGTPTPGQPNITAPVVDGVPDAGVTPDGPPSMQPDAGGGGSNNGGGGGGCDAGGGATWIGLAFVVLIIARRARG